MATVEMVTVREHSTEVLAVIIVESFACQNVT